MLGFIQDYVNPREYLWQLPILLAFAAGWLLLGPYLLRRSVRKHAPRPKLKFRSYVLTCFLAGAAGCILSGILAIMLAAIGERLKTDLRIMAACLGLLVALLTAYLVVYAMLNLTARQAIKIATPAMGTTFILGLAVGISCVVPAIFIRHDRTAFQECHKNLYSLNEAIREYETAVNHGQPPENLAQLLEAKLKTQVGKDSITCTNRQGAMFYMPIRSLSRTQTSQKLRICDLKSNHRAGRNWMYANGTPQHGSEKDFQDILRLPENADFARALQAVDK